MEGAEVTSVIFNLAILAGYFFAALYVGPKIKGTSLWTKINGAMFFITCGLHHLEGAIHVSFTQGAAVEDIYTDFHMLLIDSTQAFFIWAFIYGLAMDLIWRGTPPSWMPQPFKWLTLTAWVKAPRLFVPEKLPEDSTAASLRRENTSKVREGAARVREDVASAREDVVRDREAAADERDRNGG